MTSFDLGRLSLNLLPILGSSLDAPTVETNFREISEAVRLLKESSEGATFGNRYVETFTATTSKTVTHNLDANYPQVSVYNSAGTQIQLIVTNLDPNQIRLNFTGTLTNAVVAVDVSKAS